MTFLAFTGGKHFAEAARKLGADKTVISYSQMWQYKDHIVGVYFLAGNTEIAHINPLDLLSCDTYQALLKEPILYSRKWGVDLSSYWVVPTLDYTQEGRTNED